MANTFLNNFLVPLLEIIVILGFFAGISTWFIIIFSRAWKKELKFILKYTIFRRKFNETDVNWIIDALAQGFDYVDVKKLMLISGQPSYRTNEIVWIFNKINKEMHKGGIKYGRPSKEHNRENQSSTELPKVTSSSSSSKA